MSNLIPLHFERFDVRMILRDGVPWWVLVDVAAALDLSNPTKLAGRLEDYQKAVLTIREGSLGQRRRMNLVNEAGIYALTLNSRKEEAKRFGRWLFTEVLPSIRKHGSYPPPSQIEADDLPSPDRIQGDDLSTPAGRLLSELHRVTGIEDRRKLRDWCEGIISKGRFAQLSIGNGALSALRHDDTWITLAGAGVDLSYVINDIWSATPDERALIANLRSLGDRKGIVMHRANLQIAALLDEDETPLLT